MNAAGGEGGQENGQKKKGNLLLATGIFSQQLA
jgi:hypothetical protein